MREHQYQVHEDYKEVHQDHKEHQDHNYQQDQQGPEDEQDYEADLEAGEGGVCFLGEPGAGARCHVPGSNMVLILKLKMMIFLTMMSMSGSINTAIVFVQCMAFFKRSCSRYCCLQC